MAIHFNVPGKKRKELAQETARWLGADLKYNGAPSFAYAVGSFTIDKEGNLIPDSSADSETVERLVQHLYDEGFESDLSEQEHTTLCISVPRAQFTNESLGNLNLIITAKGALIRKALGADDLQIETDDEKVSFPWFSGDSSPDEIQAYEKLVCAICDMAKNQKRINVTDHAVENERYAFRCFLLRLGFIGDEYKAARKILLSKLEGSSAFKRTKTEGENNE